MDERQRLIKLYEAELEKNRQIKKDMDSLGNMTDEQLFALVEKAQMFYQILEKGWEQIAGGDLRKKDVMPVLMNRAVLKNDFSQIQQIEDEVSILKANLQSSKEKWKQYHARNREYAPARIGHALTFITVTHLSICYVIRLIEDDFIPTGNKFRRLAPEFRPVDFISQYGIHLQFFRHGYAHAYHLTTCVHSHLRARHTGKPSHHGIGIIAKTVFLLRLFIRACAIRMCRLQFTGWQECWKLGKILYMLPEELCDLPVKTLAWLIQELLKYAWLLIKPVII